MLLRYLFSLPDFLLKQLGYFVVFRYEAGIGDNIAITAFIREFNLTYPQFKIIVLTDKAFVFRNSPRIYKTFPLNNLPSIAVRGFFKAVRLAKMKNCCEFRLPQTKNNKLEQQMLKNQELDRKSVV